MSSPPVDAADYLAVAGVTGGKATDGVVFSASAVLPAEFQLAGQNRIRYVDACHVPQRILCPDSPLGLVSAGDEGHPTFQIARDFLLGKEPPQFLPQPQASMVMAKVFEPYWEPKIPTTLESPRVFVDGHKLRLLPDLPQPIGDYCTINEDTRNGVTAPLPPGDHLIRIESKAYFPVEQSVSAPAGHPLVVELTAVPAPELRVEILSYCLGGTAADVMVRNEGKGRSGQTSLSLLVSKDRRDPGYLALARGAVPALEPGDWHRGSYRLDVTPALPGGLLAVVDPDDAVKELDEANNSDWLKLKRCR